MHNRVSAGVYPAAVTPFDAKGRVDPLQSAKLMAWFESAGCQGVVLSGTNGEGPSLSAIEKRDQVRDVRTVLPRILGVATPSLDEAIWLAKRAAESQCAALLVMPPAYFRSASLTGLTDWFLKLLDASPVPCLLYNYPKMTGIALVSDLLEPLADHPNLAGLKDSSGERDNLDLYRSLLPNHPLFVGDETLLLDALDAGWSGTISGAANIVPHWLVRIHNEYTAGDVESARTKFDLLLPVLIEIRSSPQPALNKGILAALGILESGAVRLPLEPCADLKIQNLTSLVDPFLP